MAAFYMRGIDNIKKYRVQLNYIKDDKSFLDLLDELENNIKI